MGERTRSMQLTQEQIVLAIAVLLFVAFAATLKGFVAADNLLALVQNVSILGILGLGMAIAIIGRGIDLAIVTTMTMSVAWVLSLAGHGLPPAAAAAAGFAFAMLIGSVAGVLIAYVEIPAIFATLALASVIYGFASPGFGGRGPDLCAAERRMDARHRRRCRLGRADQHYRLPRLCRSRLFFLQFTKPGRFLRAIGDNPLRARIGGIPVRPMIVLQYIVSSVTGFVAGIVMATLIGSMNTRLVNSTMVYDVILVVVLGGIGLSGGRGGVRNVLVGTLLIGILLNGMTIMDIPYILQNLIKGVILLVAIIVNSLINPRDEQTSQQGDI